MGYCTHCGMLKETSDGICAQCAEDAKVSEKRRSRVRSGGESMDIQSLERIAKSHQTYIAACMLIAIHDAMESGSLYGWLADEQ